MPSLYPLREKIGLPVSGTPSNLRLPDAMMILHSGVLMTKSAHGSRRRENFRDQENVSKKKISFSHFIFKFSAQCSPPIFRLLDPLMRSDCHPLTTVAPILYFCNFSTDLKFLSNFSILCHMLVPTEHGLHLRAM